MSEEGEKPTKPINGGRNLIVLGLVSIAIVVVSTCISLYIYRATGDIYLDRSRPGFISAHDTPEPVSEPIQKFSSDGEVDISTFSEYIRELDTIIENLEGSEDSFNEAPLSDDALKVTVNDEDDEEEKPED